MAERLTQALEPKEDPKIGRPQPVAGLLPIPRFPDGENAQPEEGCACFNAALSKVVRSTNCCPCPNGPCRRSLRAAIGLNNISPSVRHITPLKPMLVEDEKGNYQFISQTEDKKIEIDPACRCKDGNFISPCNDECTVSNSKEGLTRDEL